MTNIIIGVLCVPVVLAVVAIIASLVSPPGFVEPQGPAPQEPAAATARELVQEQYEQESSAHMVRQAKLSAILDAIEAEQGYPVLRASDLEGDGNNLEQEYDLAAKVVIRDRPAR